MINPTTLPSISVNSKPLKRNATNMHTRCAAIVTITKEKNTVCLEYTTFAEIALK